MQRWTRAGRVCDGPAVAVAAFGLQARSKYGRRQRSRCEQQDRIFTTADLTGSFHPIESQVQAKNVDRRFPKQTKRASGRILFHEVHHLVSTQVACFSNACHL